MPADELSPIKTRPRHIRPVPGLLSRCPGPPGSRGCSWRPPHRSLKAPTMGRGPHAFAPSRALSLKAAAGSPKLGMQPPAGQRRRRPPPRSTPLPCSGTRRIGLEWGNRADRLRTTGVTGGPSRSADYSSAETAARLRSVPVPPGRT